MPGSFKSHHIVAPSLKTECFVAALTLPLLSVYRCVRCWGRGLCRCVVGLMAGSTAGGRQILNKEPPHPRRRRIFFFCWYVRASPQVKPGALQLRPAKKIEFRKIKTHLSRKQGAKKNTSDVNPSLNSIQ